MAAALLALALAAVGCTSDPAVFRAYQSAGEAALRDGRYERAEALLARAGSEAEALGPDERAAAALARARLLRILERPEDAETQLLLAEAALAEAGPRDGGADDARAILERERGELLLARGDVAGAESRFRASVAETARAAGHEDPAMGLALLGLARALRAGGRGDEARLAVARAREIFAGERGAGRLRPADPGGQVLALTLQATLDRDSGDLPAARGALLEAFRIAAAEGGSHHPLAALALLELARTERQAGDAAAAREAARRADAILRESLPEGHALRVEARALADGAAP